MDDIEKLHRAIQIGSVEEVKTLVKLGVDLDYVLGMRGTALCAAIEANNAAIADYLIRSGCSVNTRDYDGEPPLLLAIRKEKQRSFSLRKESLECAKLLIDSEHCDLDQVDPLTTKSAIHFATEQGMIEVVKWLMAAGCDINKVDTNGNMPVHLAVYDGHHEIVKLLAASPVCLMQSYNKAGLVPLHICSNNGDLSSMKILLKYLQTKEQHTFHVCHAVNTVLTNTVNVNAVTQYEKDTCLHLAARNGHSEVVKLLLQHGANVNMRNSLGQPPLLLACSETSLRKHRDNAIPVMLLKNGANPNIKGTLRSSFIQSDLEMTPLIIAAINKNTELTKALVKHGADVNMMDNMGQTALMVALLKNSIDVAQYLLNEFGGNGLVVNGVNDLGETCLHAVLKCYSRDNMGVVADLTRTLLGAGAVQVADGAGQTPLMRAFEGEALEVLDVLLEDGTSDALAGRNTMLLTSVAQGQLDTMKVILSHGGHINQRTADGESLLYISIYNEELAIARYLVNNGCDLSQESYIFQQFDRGKHDGDSNDDDDYDDDEYDDEVDDDDVLCALKYNEKFRNWLQKTASSPRGLKLMCMITVRSYFMEKNIHFKKMDRLPLPLKLRKVLRYKDG